MKMKVRKWIVRGPEWDEFLELMKAKTRGVKITRKWTWDKVLLSKKVFVEVGYHEGFGS
ncbi:MAG: hypothetical protein H3Z54_11300 [archaeon]|nr:hypothetical protein [archaeon]